MPLNFQKKKIKISHVKHSQHLKNKKNYTKPLKKKEQLQASQSSKLQNTNAKGGKKKVFGKPTGTSSHKKKRTGQSVPVAVNETEMDDDTVQDILENVAMDDDDHETTRLKAKKRKRLAADYDAEDEAKNAKHFEKEYAQMTLAEEKTKKRVVSLLPIKTKAGEVVTRTAEMEYKDREEENQSDEEEDEEDEIEEEVDSDDDIIKDNVAMSTDLAELSKNAVSTADLLIYREQEIARQKYRIGIICSGILEKPEDKMKNFFSSFRVNERT
ncbi:hypothetical protein HA402_006901 [Bradysia odoriphaga]|nr:hypothetical protein HA402_006901 [Bradysia odoriphaga]